MATIDKLSDERRTRHERRSSHFKAFLYQFVNPRRRHHGRRQADSHGYHVDFHEPTLLAVVLIILCLCIVDIYATLTLLQQGGVELNPLMRELIHTDVWVFYIFKYTVTAVGLLVLLSYRRFRLYRGLSAVHTLYAVLAVYLALVVYQFRLLNLAAG